MLGRCFGYTEPMLWIALILFPAVGYLAACAGRLPHATGRDLALVLKPLAVVIAAGLIFGAISGFARGKLQTVLPEVETINKARQSADKKYISPSEAEIKIVAAQTKQQAKASDSSLAVQTAQSQAALFVGIGLLLSTPILALYLVRQRVLKTTV
jgi:hypothetical protein